MSQQADTKIAKDTTHQDLRIKKTYIPRQAIYTQQYKIQRIIYVKNMQNIVTQHLSCTQSVKKT